MITLDELKAQVGDERWGTARRQAWESALLPQLTLENLAGTAAASAGVSV